MVQMVVNGAVGEGNNGTSEVRFYIDKGTTAPSSLALIHSVLLVPLSLVAAKAALPITLYQQG